jgi:hypothetical protein
VAVILAIIIYSMAAKAIWDKRELLDGFLNPLNEHPFVNTITTQIEITTEERPMVGKEDATVGIQGVEQSTDRGVGNQYSVDIHVDERTQAARHVPAALRMRSLTREVAKNKANAEAWLYARVAFLFFIALLITWVSLSSHIHQRRQRLINLQVPSSINRLYAIVKPNTVNFGLNYAASFVFPLQAFWNAIVYIITSQNASRELIQVITFRKTLQEASKDLQNPPSPSSQRRLTIHAQKDPMGTPKRLRSIEQVSSRDDSGGEQQELQDMEPSRWSTDSRVGRGRARHR